MNDVVLIGGGVLAIILLAGGGAWMWRVARGKQKS